jgi:hypothetical protein
MTRRRLNIGMAAVLLLSTTARADVVSDWNTIMLATVSGQNPFAQARFAAITHLAVFEAVNAIKGDYKPYGGTIMAPEGASAEAAAVAAAYRVLATYFPGSSTTLDTARASSLATIPAGSAKDAGIAVGEAAANAMIAARANDGSAPAEFYLPPSTNPGQWQLTPSCQAAGGLLLHWRRLVPFRIQRADQFRSDPPPALISSKYARDWNDVKTVGGIGSTDRPQDRADVARFYATVAAPALWNMVATQVAARQGVSLSENTRTLALLNMALSDGAIAAFDTKYHYNFWRPEDAIRSAATDENSKTEAVPSFSPFIVAPCFPSYPSAHASLSNAAREVLERLYGGRPQSITLSSPAVAGVTLTYTNFKQITDDIDDARIYGGIHFRFDQEAGTEQGRRVGEYVYKESLGQTLGCGCDQNADTGRLRN